MATTTDVNDGLRNIERAIRDSRAAYLKAKANIEMARNQLANIPTTYGAVITEIDSFTGADTFETQAKDFKARMVSEYIELRNEIDALIGTAEFS